jgi:hypothetical protein
MPITLRDRTCTRTRECYVVRDEVVHAAESLAPIRRPSADASPFKHAALPNGDMDPRQPPALMQCSANRHGLKRRARCNAKILDIQT